MALGTLLSLLAIVLFAAVLVSLFPDARVEHLRRQSEVASMVAYGTSTFFSLAFLGVAYALGWIVFGTVSWPSTLLRRLFPTFNDPYAEPIGEVTHIPEELLRR